MTTLKELDRIALICFLTAATNALVLVLILLRG